MFLIDFFRPHLKMHKSAQSARPLSAAASAELSEEILKRGNSLRIRVTGTSMAPFINGGDDVTIKMVNSLWFRTGDIVFYMGRDRQYILHRIIKRQKKRSGAYVFRTKGDAMMAYDSPVSEESVLGLVYRIEKRKKDGALVVWDLLSCKWRIVNLLLAVVHRLRSALYLKVYSPLKRGW